MHNALLVIHVLAAASWLGAGVAVTQLSSMTLKQESPGAGMAVAFERLGPRTFMPAGIIVAITGILLVIGSSWQFSNLFVIIGIIVVVTGAFLGARVFPPLTQKVQQADQAADVSKVRDLYRRYWVLALVDVGLVAVAATAMLLKLHF